jgi:hypothetical protein
MRNESSIRKFCHGLSLYEILSKVIHLSIIGRRSSNQDFIKKVEIMFFLRFSRSYLLMSLQNLSSPKPILSSRKKISHGYPSQNSIFWEILFLLWAIPCIGSSFYCFQAFKSSCISLKRLKLSKGGFDYLEKIGLSSFINRTIRFSWV